jgi:phage gp29-like protein
MGILNSISSRVIRTLQRFAPETVETVVVKPRTGRLISGARSDYAIDTAARKSSPEQLARMLKAADQGDTVQQYEVFEEVERDPVVFRVYFKRRLAVVSKELQVMPSIPNDPRAQQASDLVHGMLFGDDTFKGMAGFQDGLFDLTDAIGKAFAASQVVWEVEDGKHVPQRFERWPQREFNLGKPWEQYAQEEDRLRLLTEENRTEGVPLDTYPAGQWLVHKQKAFSQPLARAALFRSVCWYWLFKKFGVKDWSIFLERYGIPPRLGKYGPAADAKERAELWDALINLGKDHAAIFPDNSTIELLETKGRSGAATGDPHQGMLDYCDAQINIAISGSTMSTTQGDRGARSAKEAFGAEEQQQTEFDCERLSETLRQQLAAPIVHLNLGLDWPVPQLRFLFEEDEDLGARSERDERIHGMGYPIAMSYVEETYGIPQPEEGEAILPPKSSGGGGLFGQPDADLVDATAELEEAAEGDEVAASLLAAVRLLQSKKKSCRSVRWNRSVNVASKQPPHQPKT